jgi:hypothetical protein
MDRLLWQKEWEHLKEVNINLRSYLTIQVFSYVYGQTLLIPNKIKEEMKK